MFELRPYQKEAVKAIENEWINGNKKTLLVCPTGTGKTQIFSSAIKDQIRDGSRVLILAHRNELLDQVSNRLKNTYGIESALEKAESTWVGSPLSVTVASIQSLANPSRLNKFNKDYFKTIVVDEAQYGYWSAVTSSPSLRASSIREVVTLHERFHPSLLVTL